MKYDFEFSWASTYGFAAKLVAQTCERGLVVDLGCGAGSFAAPLDELGFDYHGLEYDEESVELCRSRGIACDPVDLTDTDGTIERVRAAAHGRPVRAVSLLDVIEHLVDPERVFAGLRRIVESLTVDGIGPKLIVSIPNVAHADLATKLVAGRWDVVDVGLLDDTHVTLFTEHRVVDTFRRHGFRQLAANDVVIPDTEQRYPTTHPAVAADTPLSTHLRSVRRRANASGDTYQFVRCYELDAVAEVVVERPTLEAAGEFDGPALSVVVLVDELVGLADLLTCLAAQHHRDLEVVLVPGRDISTADLDRAVAPYAPGFVEAVRVVPATGRRAARLNAALDAVRGRHVVVLDQRALVTGRWAGELIAAAAAFPGRTIRARAVDQPIDVDRARVVPTGGFRPAGDGSVDVVDLLGARPPELEALVFPLEAVRGLGHRLDDSLGDDAATWLFVLRLLADTGVVDTATVDLVRRRADRPEPSPAETAAAWAEVVAALDGEPLLLPPGSIARVGDLHDLRRQRDEALQQLDTTTRRVEALERSRYWTITAPLRRVSSSPRLRRLLGRGGS